MKYLAHKDGEREQALKEHLENTACLAQGFADRFEKGEWGYCAGKGHDIGKYSKEFQKKIKEKIDIRVDHSTAGAQAYWQKGGRHSFISYCIAGHHAGLPDTGSKSDSASFSTLEGRKKKKIPDYHYYKEEIQIPELSTDPFDITKVSNPDFSLSFFIRMLYSCLVDADFLDTERFMNAGKVEREPGEDMYTLFQKLQTHISNWLLNEKIDTVNGRRTEILKHCLDCGEKGRGLFRLTVPTGGGKTIASMAFALRHAVKNHMDRIIYVIPYTSIIEQNAKVFRDVLGDDNVLENHCNIDYTSSEELKPMQLASENWDKPIVVTTNVQFFESLFGNRSAKCRKLHNIANSVIIFDEAQMLPNDYLVPCIAAMEELLQNYRTSIVLCTATQPALASFFREKTKAVELCPRMPEQFRFFERVTYRNMGKVTQENLVDQLKQENQALCIVNTKKRAQAIFKQLKGEGVYHLSTAMYPLHRKEVLEEIKTRLRTKKRCIVISTSLVEAGVDLDFQTVYRQLAGIDSIIQAAGRCNRNGKRGKEESIVCIFQFEDAERAPGQRQQMDITQTMLAEGWELSSLDSIEQYFGRLYHYRGESLDKKKIMEEFKGRRYNFAKVGREFKLIEEDTKTIFIGREKAAQELLWQLKNKGYTKSGMRLAQQYCVQVYEREFENLYGSGKVVPVSEDIEDFYELADLEQYTEEMGLELGTESGMALFS